METGAGSISVAADDEIKQEQLEALTDEQLEQLLDDTLSANEVLATEMQMFDNFVKRVESKIQYSVVGGLRRRSGSLALASSLVEVEVGGRKRSKSKSRKTSLGPQLHLTAEQQCEVAQRELDEYAEQVRVANEESDRHVDELKARLQEADLRTADIKKEEYEFERDIVKAATKADPEKVFKYLEDKLRAKEAGMYKLGLKYTALEQETRKLKRRKEQTEELHVREQDYNQLEMVNQQYVDRLDERKQELERLRLFWSNTLNALNKNKKKLNSVTTELDRIKADIVAKHELLKEIDDETKTVEEERREAERINRHLKQQLTSHTIPDVMEYVDETANLRELQKAVKSWERKVDISSRALKSYQKTWRKMKSSGQHTAD